MQKPLKKQWNEKTKMGGEKKGCSNEEIDTCKKEGIFFNQIVWEDPFQWSDR